MKSNSSLTILELLAYRGAIQGGTSVAVIEGQTLKAATHYMAGFLNTLENGEVILAKDTKKVGERSINSNYFPEGTDFLVTEIRVLFDTTANVQNAAVTLASFGKTAAPENFKNGELVIRQGTDLFKTSGTDVTNIKAVAAEDYAFRQVVPFLLRGGLEFNVNIKTASAAVADQAYKIELRGFEMVNGTKA